MNLRGAVSGAVQAINPTVPATIKISAGYTTNDDGSRVPKYVTKYGVQVRVQSLTFGDLRQVEGLNLNGTRRAIYVPGVVDGIVRPENKGGDLIILTTSRFKGTWLVAMVLESWRSWTKVAVTLQSDSTT